MALSDLSFKLYTNSALTTVFTGSYSLLHNTDLSDNPQDLGPLYLGSIQPNRLLHATSNPGIDNIILTPTDAISVWTGATAYTVGQDRQPTVANGYRYEVTTAGTSGGTQPTWPIGIGTTVTDGTVVWTNRGLKHQKSEIKLASTLVGLDTAVAGASLNLGNTILSGTINAKPIYIRITNAVTQPSAAGVPEINVSINSIQEEVAP